jgi:hypothetical protein
MSILTVCRRNKDEDSKTISFKNCLNKKNGRIIFQGVPPKENYDMKNLYEAQVSLYNRLYLPS